MGGVGLTACQGFLVVGSLCQCSGGWNWMSSLWSAVKCPVKCPEFWGVYGFSMALGSPSFNVQGWVPVLLENYCGVSCTDSC